MCLATVRRLVGVVLVVGVLGDRASPDAAAEGTATTMAAAAAATAERFGARDRLVYMRIPKTGSKTTVALLQTGWLFGGDPTLLNVGCHAHHWIGSNQNDCAAAALILASLLNNTAKRIGAFAERAARDEVRQRQSGGGDAGGGAPADAATATSADGTDDDDPRRACAFSGHCSYEVRKMRPRRAAPPESVSSSPSLSKRMFRCAIVHPTRGSWRRPSPPSSTDSFSSASVVQMIASKGTTAAATTSGRGKKCGGRPP